MQSARGSGGARQARRPNTSIMGFEFCYADNELVRMRALAPT
jgi:hypothetical protein